MLNTRTWVGLKIQVHSIHSLNPSWVLPASWDIEDRPGPHRPGFDKGWTGSVARTICSNPDCGSHCLASRPGSWSGWGSLAAPFLLETFGWGKELAVIRV